jgi:hypothetical protein
MASHDEKYFSVFQEYYKLHSNVLTPEKQKTLNLQLGAIAKRVDEHMKGCTHDLTEGERTWLVELLFWKEVCKFNSANRFDSPLTTLLVGKAQFPGERPRDPKEQTPLNNCEIPPCNGCIKEYKKPADDRCPLLRVVSCNREGHPNFKIRYGRENFVGPACPVCRQEEGEEISKDKQDGWVFV